MNGTLAALGSASRKVFTVVGVVALLFYALVYEAEWAPILWALCATFLTASSGDLTAVWFFMGASVATAHHIRLTRRAVRLALESS